MRNTIFDKNLEESFSYNFGSDKEYTDIGYSQDEIAKSTNEELIIISRAIHSYFHSRNLKKRNPNYMKAFKRINEELKKRKLNNQEKIFLNNSTLNLNNKSQKNKTNIENKLCYCDNNSKFFKFEKTKLKQKINTGNTKSDFIKRKRANIDQTTMKFDIPSFLQDKISKEKFFFNGLKKKNSIISETNFESNYREKLEEFNNSSNIFFQILIFMKHFLIKL